MAVSSIVLDIRANTTRALSDFKRFSAQLDNKFLISGLKLDVVRNSLSQINREFQKAIGEQGLVAGSSIKAAENQAALIFQTFKGASVEASQAMTENFSKSLSDIAIKAGGTGEDIKKAIGAISWISPTLGEDVRKQLSAGIMQFEKDSRRAGVGSGADIMQKFLRGAVSPMDLINSTNSLEAAVGKRLSEIGGVNINQDERARGRIVESFFEDSGGLLEQLEQLGKETAGYKGIIEDLNTRLFNPRSGIFGSLREIAIGVEDKTTLFRETESLVETVFGKQGTFVRFFGSIGQIFGLEDPLAMVLRGVRWLTRQFERLNAFLESPMIRAIVGTAEKVVQGIAGFITSTYDSLRGVFTEQSTSETIYNIRTLFTDLSSNLIGALDGKQGREIKANLRRALGIFGDGFRSLTDFLSSESTIGVVSGYSARAVDNINGFFEAIFNTVDSGQWDPDQITASIRQIGTDIRSTIRTIGGAIRGADVSAEGSFILEIITTVIEEVARTFGAVASEAIKTVFANAPAILGGAISSINAGLKGVFSEIFGEFSGGILAAIGTGVIVASFSRTILLGIRGFAARLVSSLPGSNWLLSRFGRGRGPGGVGGRVAGDALARTQGARGAFEVRIVSQLNTIIACLCGPGRMRPGAGAGGGPGGQPRTPAGRAPGYAPGLTQNRRFDPRSSTERLADMRQAGFRPGSRAGAYDPRNAPTGLFSRSGIGRGVVRAGGRGAVAAGVAAGAGALLPQLPYPTGPSPRSGTGQGVVRASGQGASVQGATVAGAGRTPPMLSYPLARDARSAQARLRDMRTLGFRPGSRPGRYDPRNLPAPTGLFPRGSTGRAGVRGAMVTAAGITVAALVAGLMSSRDKAKSSELPPELLELIRIQKEENDDALAGGATSEQLKELSKAQAQELEDEKQFRQEQKIESGRETTRGILGAGAGLAGMAAGGKLGAVIGTFIAPGAGTAVGSLIGGVLGGILGEEAIGLLSDPVLDGIANFGGALAQGFSSFTSSIGSMWTTVSSGIGDGINSLTTAVTGGLQSAANSITNFNFGEFVSDRIGQVQSLASRVGTGARNLAEGAWQTITGNFTEAVKNFGKSTTSLWDRISSWRPSLPNFGAHVPIIGRFAGLNFAGPALAQESRNSGAEALVVNKSEFVIPSNGFSTLAGLVENRLKTSGGGGFAAGQQVVKADFNITIQASGTNASTLAQELEGPVMDIINRAWAQATTSIVMPRNV